MERHGRLTIRTVAVVLAAAIAGLLFAPVFGLVPLLLPVGVPAAVVLAVTLLCARRPRLVDWRPLLAALAGLLAVAESLLFATTAAGLPTGRTLRALADGVTSSWRLVLQSTWPARADPDLLIFVPLLVVVAAVLGVEVLLRLRAPLPALLPSLAVVVLSQVYAALAPGPAAVAALAYAAVAGMALATGATFLRVAAAAAVGVVAAGLTTVLPVEPARYSLQDGEAVALEQTLPDNPLDGIAFRLQHPDTEVFRVGGGADVDRWQLVVLDGFDGVNWTATGPYRRLGTELGPGPTVTVKVQRKSATLTVAGTGGPWLPSQTWPAAVKGVAPKVAERYGSLLLEGTDGAARYQLSWWQPEVKAAALGDAAIDESAPGGFGGVGDVPEGVEELARQVMRGLRPSFRTALLLEEYLRTNYRAAVGQNLPTGHAWPQLTNFLLVDKRGTSEQFAAAYVAMARIVGIPARLAVGFRVPAGRSPDGSAIVRNADVLAWPEVAVRGVGWVPLDPSSAAAGATAGSGLAAQAERARTQQPAPQDLRDPPVTPVTPPTRGWGSGVSVPWMALLAVPLLPLVGWPVGVPAAWTLRSWRRRRRRGTAAVLGAWAEVRDRLRAYGVPVTPGMTVRDVSAAAGSVTDPETVEEIGRLAVTVDRASWSGAGPSQDDDVMAAWESVRVVRRGLAGRGLLRRLRAVLNPRPLLPVTAGRSRRGSASAD